MDFNEQQDDSVFDLVVYERLKKGEEDAQTAIKALQDKMKTTPAEICSAVSNQPADTTEILKRTEKHLIGWAQYAQVPPPNMQHLYSMELATQALRWHMEKEGALALDPLDQACGTCPAKPQEIKLLCQQVGAAALTDAQVAVQVLGYQPQWATVKAQIAEAQTQLALDLQLGQPVFSIKSFIFKYFLKHKQLYDLNAALRRISEQNKLGLQYE